MAKRVAQRRAYRQHSHGIVQDTSIVRIDQESAEILAQQNKLFREQFRREPEPEDPFFFDSGVSTPQFLSDESQEEVWRSLLQTAGNSGIDPAIVYAMNKTGRIVTETNLQFLTDADLQEWNDAWPSITRRLNREKRNKVCGSRPPTPAFSELGY